MMKLETPIGEFTTDSYKIPAGDTLAVSPTIISFSSDDYKIITHRSIYPNWYRCLYPSFTSKLYVS